MEERRFDPTLKDRLDSPERRKQLPPEQILKLLELKGKEAIADLGAGTGYFTFPAARETNGLVYAIDVAPQMLEELRTRSGDQQVANVQLLQGELPNLPLPDSAVDCVIASFVLHEVDPLEDSLKEMGRILKPGGKALCVEWEKQPAENGPRAGHRIHSSEMRAAVERTGFHVLECRLWTDKHYVLVFRKD